MARLFGFSIEDKEKKSKGGIILTDSILKGFGFG